jgi:hypothetical protein
MAARTAGESTSAEALGEWLAHYLDANRGMIADDRDFARWLEEEYVPLAGGWHY